MKYLVIPTKHTDPYIKKNLKSKKGLALFVKGYEY